MTNSNYNDPEALLAAFVALAADILGVDTSEIDADVSIDNLFKKLRHWRRFSDRHLELAQISSEDAIALMRDSQPDHADSKWHAEMRALSVLAGFSVPARKLLEKRQEKFEAPTIRSLSATYATGVYHPCGIAAKMYEPKTRREVFKTAYFVVVAIPVLSAIFAWGSCSASECVHRPHSETFAFVSILLSIFAVVYFGIFLSWGFRALRG
ncbi:hypothetical protein [Psychromarinibacter halotolerans]|uniref:Uncharacterized protein n=1 Tax=Psychromarinibacter halotolerans TaxID=1775175 RepID=A0ABV7GXN8_9RHOB|nr:hypothetical protein [Psychromarinibacter halotolerans]MDF0598693.1 hypothetical protein [Psychromarinibacter halotolerans]